MEEMNYVNNEEIDVIDGVPEEECGSTSGNWMVKAVAGAAAVGIGALIARAAIKRKKAKSEEPAGQQPAKEKLTLKERLRERP